MKKILQNTLIVMVFLAGLSLLLYPFISNEWNNYRQSKLITTYEQVITQQEEKDYSAEWEKAKAYNDSLLPMVLPDSFAAAATAVEPDPEYMDSLNLLGDGMMGYVEVPKIDIKLPVYHTTGEEVLLKAAGHLEGSTLPVGGEGTHAVISAHRGLPSAVLFTDLDKLMEGDHFLLYILDERLCYEVDRISVIEPYETECLAPEEGQEYVTLMTCTPYGVNSHRLLVRGHRIPYESEVVEVMQEEAKAATQISIHTDYLLWVIVGLSVTALFIVAIIVLDRIQRRRKIAKVLKNIELEC